MSRFNLARSLVRSCRSLAATAARPAAGPARMAPLRANTARQFHTCLPALDQQAEFANQLMVEIKDEEDNGEAPQFSPTMGDFTFTKHEVGHPLVVLTNNTDDGDTVTVTVDINECIHSEAFEDEGEGDEDAPSGKEPQFQIEIAKASGDSMIFKCEAGEDREGSDVEYIFAIREVGFKPKGMKDEDVYLSEPNYWDDDLEASMRGYLASKGVDGEFIEDFCHYVHDKEYADYLSLLESMYTFTKE